jgi:hypothetical protein
MLAAAGIVAYRRMGRSGRQENGAAASQERQAALEQELRVLKARLGALERQNAEQQLASSREAPRPLAAAPAPAPPRPGLPPPADEEDTRRYFAALEARFAAEPRDAAWAAPVEQKLRESAGEFGERVSVKAVRCGRGMCRMDLERQPGPEAAATLQDLIRRAVTVLPQAVVQNSDDPTRLVLYFVREGDDGFPPLVGRDPAP